MRLQHHHWSSQTYWTKQVMAKAKQVAIDWYWPKVSGWGQWFRWLNSKQVKLVSIWLMSSKFHKKGSLPDVSWAANDKEMTFLLLGGYGEEGEWESVICKGEGEVRCVEGGFGVDYYVISWILYINVHYILEWPVGHLQVYPYPSPTCIPQKGWVSHG